MDTDVYAQVKASIKQCLKSDLEHYKSEQMNRRLDSWLVRSHPNTRHDYFNALSSDAMRLNWSAFAII